MDDIDYARKWSLKLAWHAANGFLPFPERGDKGTVMWTDDIGGVKVPAWRQLPSMRSARLLRGRRGAARRGAARRPAAMPSGRPPTRARNRRAEGRSTFGSANEW